MSCLCAERGLDVCPVGDVVRECQTGDGSLTRPVTPASSAVEAPAGVTAKRLLQHARHFGAEGVAETAAEFGIVLDREELKRVAREPVQQRKVHKRPKPVPVKRQAQDLLDRGLAWKEVAEILDLTPTKSSILRRELGVEL